MTKPNQLNLDRAKGGLYGLACGDALGAPLEFTRPSGTARFPALQEGPLKHMKGGGTWNTAPGQCTDDTHMAICLAQALAMPGGYDCQNAAEFYLEWRSHTFDCGGLTSRSLGDFSRTKKARWAGYKAWGGSSAGNGSLMRTAPIGVAISDPAENLRISMLDSGITHFAPACQMACVAYNAAVAEAVYRTEGMTQDERKVAMFAAAQAAFAKGCEEFLRMFPLLPNWAHPDFAGIKADFEAAQKDDPSLYGQEDQSVHLVGGGSGYVRTGFRVALWELLHAPSYEAAVIDVANRGGDADTNGAIVGGLLGARDGFEAIPEGWRQAVWNALQDGLPEAPADSKARVIGHRSPKLAFDYHPQRFEVLVSKLVKASETQPEASGAV